MNKDTFLETSIALTTIWLMDKIISIATKRTSYLPIQMNLRSSLLSSKNRSKLKKTNKDNKRLLQSSWIIAFVR